MELTTQQQNKLLRLAKVADGGEVAIIGEINALEDRLNQHVEELSGGISDALQTSLETQKMEGPQGIQGEQGEQGEKGDTGEAGADGKDGKDGVDGKPGKDGKDGKDGHDGVDGLDGKDAPVESLEALKAELAALTESKAESDTALPSSIEMIAAQIVANRTNYLLNKINTLQAQVDGISTSGGDVTLTILSVTSNTTLTQTSGRYLVKSDATSGNITLNLPSAVGNTAEYSIIKTDSSTNTVTVDASGTQTISNNLTQVIQFQNSSMDITSDNANWWIV